MQKKLIACAVMHAVMDESHATGGGAMAAMRVSEDGPDPHAPQMAPAPTPYDEAAMAKAAGSGTAGSSAPAASAGPVLYKVWDTNAGVGAVRRHDIIIRQYADGREPDIKTYALGNESDNDGTPMPVDHALKFLSDKAFVVKNQAGDRILPPAKIDGGLGSFQLAPDQVIAFYHELSKPALYKRCKLAPGGENIQGGDSVETMIEFLQKWTARQNAPTGADVEAEIKMNQGELGGKVEAGGLDKLFGGDSPLIRGR